jgi:hypothetical protein
MFTLLKSLHSRQVYLSEPVSFVAALVIAEMFYKFHSFLLETGAFLVTWFCRAIVHTVAGWVLPGKPAAESEHFPGGYR